MAAQLIEAQLARVVLTSHFSVARGFYKEGCDGSLEGRQPFWPCLCSCRHCVQFRRAVGEAKDRVKGKAVMPSRRPPSLTSLKGKGTWGVKSDPRDPRVLYWLFLQLRTRMSVTNRIWWPILPLTTPYCKGSKHRYGPMPAQVCLKENSTKGNMGVPLSHRPQVRDQGLPLPQTPSY